MESVAGWLLMEEVVAAGPEGRHIEVLNSRCEELEGSVRQAERLAASSEQEAAECRKEVARLRDEAAGREALLEQELDLNRAAEEEELLRLRNRVRALRVQGDAQKAEGSPEGAAAPAPEQPVETETAPAPGATESTTTEMHLHALALIRDRSRLLRRLHRAETDVMILRGQVHRLESSIASGVELSRAGPLIGAAKAVAAELGVALPDAVRAPDADLESVETIVRHLRPVFLAEAPQAPLSSLPVQMLVAYARCLEDALMQCRADTVVLRQRCEGANEREMDMSGMLKEATQRELNSAEVRFTNRLAIRSAR